MEEFTGILHLSQSYGMMFLSAYRPSFLIRIIHLLAVLTLIVNASATSRTLAFGWTARYAFTRSWLFAACSSSRPPVGIVNLVV